MRDNRTDGRIQYVFQEAEVCEGDIYVWSHCGLFLSRSDQRNTGKHNVVLQQQKLHILCKLGNRLR